MYRVELKEVILQLSLAILLHSLVAVVCHVCWMKFNAGMACSHHLGNYITALVSLLRDSDCSLCKA